jgi:hypothetical protein
VKVIEYKQFIGWISFGWRSSAIEPEKVWLENLAHLEKKIAALLPEEAISR